MTALSDPPVLLLSDPGSLIRARLNGVIVYSYTTLDAEAFTQFLNNNLTGDKWRLVYSSTYKRFLSARVYTAVIREVPATPAKPRLDIEIGPISRRPMPSLAIEVGPVSRRPMPSMELEVLAITKRPMPSMTIEAGPVTKRPMPGMTLEAGPVTKRPMPSMKIDIGPVTRRSTEAKLT